MRMKGTASSTFLTSLPFSMKRIAVYLPLGTDTISGQAKVADALFVEVAA